MQRHFSFRHPFLRLTVLVAILTAPMLPVRAGGVSAAARTDTNRPAALAYVLERASRLADPVARREVTLAGAQMRASERNAACLAYYHRIIAGETDLEAFARITELAAALAGDDTDAFMRMVSYLTLDAAGNTQAIAAGAWGRFKNMMHARLKWFPGYPALGRFGSSGFRADDGGNQAQHIWYSVAISYRWGATVADLAARYHEWNAPGLLRHLPGVGGGRGSAMDLTLSRQGIGLGQALATHSMTPAQVAGWLRTELR